MVEISTLPKYSRINQTRPPMLAEPFDTGRLTRLGLPRYQRPIPGQRRRSRRRSERQETPLTAQNNNGHAAQSPAAGPVRQNSAPVGRPQVPERVPSPPVAPRLAGRQQSDRQAVSPFEKRFPFNPSLPLRNAAESGGYVAAGKPWSKAKEYPSNPSDQPGGSDNSPPVGKTIPDPGRGESSQPQHRNQSGDRAPRSASPGNRADNNQSEDKPAQIRPYRLPPLDFSFTEPKPSDAVDLPPEGMSAQQAGPNSMEHPELRAEEQVGFMFDPIVDPPVELPADTEELPYPPSLREILLNAVSLPSQTAILGVCADGLPVLLDLNDSAPGSLLVVGDERQHALDLLRLAVISMALRNTARGVQFIVFSHIPDAWNQWIDEQSLRRYCLDVVGAEPAQAREWIYRLSEWANQRLDGQRGGPPVILLFDTLSFLSRLSPDTRACLDELVRGGPDVRIWSIGAISTALASSLQHQLDAFDTRIWGYCQDAQVYPRLAGVPAADARSFSAPGQFAVQVGPSAEQNWLKFRLPSLDGLLP